jgi:hypothetical protein
VADEESFLHTGQFFFFRPQLRSDDLCWILLQPSCINSDSIDGQEPAARLLAVTLDSDLRLAFAGMTLLNLGGWKIFYIGESSMWTVTNIFILFPLWHGQGSFRSIFLIWPPVADLTICEGTFWKCFPVASSARNIHGNSISICSD